MLTCGVCGDTARIAFGRHHLTSVPQTQDIAEATMLAVRTSKSACPQVQLIFFTAMHALLWYSMLVAWK